MIRKPMYTLNELSELMGINYRTLLSRIKASDEKPIPKEGFSSFMLRRTPRARAARYCKDEFIDWHNRNWPSHARDVKKNHSEAT